MDIVRGLTGSEDGLQSLAKYSKIVLPSLSRLLTGPKVLPNIQSIPKFENECSMFDRQEVCKKKRNALCLLYVECNKIWEFDLMQISWLVYHSWIRIL